MLMMEVANVYREAVLLPNQLLRKRMHFLPSPNAFGYVNEPSLTVNPAGRGQAERFWEYA